MKLIVANVLFFLLPLSAFAVETVVTVKVPTDSFVAKDECSETGDLNEIRFTYCHRLQTTRDRMIELKWNVFRRLYDKFLKENQSQAKFHDIFLASPPHHWEYGNEAVCVHQTFPRDSNYQFKAVCEDHKRKFEDVKSNWRLSLSESKEGTYYRDCFGTCLKVTQVNARTSQKWMTSDGRIIEDQSFKIAESHSSYSTEQDNKKCQLIPVPECPNGH